MRKLLVAIPFLLAACVAVANTLIPMTGAGVSGGGAGAAFVGAGDTQATAYFWGSCQFAYSAAVATAGTQPTCNLIRASDSVTCDVLVAANGKWGNTASCSSGAQNGQTAAAFCNATTCSVVTLYDQSGGNNCAASPCNFIQATAAQRPTIAFSSVGSLATMSFVAANSISMANAVLALASPWTLSYVAKHIVSAGSSPVIEWGGGGACQINFQPNANQAQIFCGAGGGATVSDGSYHDMNSLVVSSASALSAINVDGTDTASLVAGTGAASGAGWIIGFDTGVSFMNGNIGEVGVWSLNSSPAQRNALCHNQSIRWGIAAC